MSGRKNLDQIALSARCHLYTTDYPFKLTQKTFYGHDAVHHNLNFNESNISYFLFVVNVCVYEY